MGFGKLNSDSEIQTLAVYFQLEQRQVTPPYRPPIKDERDLEHFDRQFTDEPVQFTPDDQ
jgi:atypical protein kinase C iota type